MKNITLPVLIVLITILSCSVEPTKTVYTANEIHTIPYGGKGTLISGDYTGSGNVVNVAGTTVTIDGVVIVDALSLNGTVIVPFGTTLIVNDVINVGGGSSFKVRGSVSSKTFTQVGNTCIAYGKIKASGKFTIGGGTTLYLENSEIEAGELVITGNIKAVHNEATQAADWYSMVQLTGAKYLNRGGGTNICGPILFNGNNDQGASGIGMTDQTSTAEGFSPNIRTAYGINSTDTLYSFDDECDPISTLSCN